MSDLTNGIEAVNGRSNITQIGIVVINGKEDSSEIDRRKSVRTAAGIYHPAHEKAHFIYPHELVFTRKDKKAMRANDNASIQSDIEVFSNLAGITETEALRQETERAIAFVGFSRNRPMHQDMPGRDRGNRFAIQMGGLLTIRCASHQHIPVMTPLLWRANHSPAEKGYNDPQKIGRALAEIEPYSPLEHSLNPLKIHQSLSREMHGHDMGMDLQTPRNRCKQSDMCIFQSLKTIIYSGSLILLAEMGASGQEENLAKMLALVTPKTKSEKESALRVESLLLDSIFSATYTNKRVSEPSQAHLVANLHDSDVNADGNIALKSVAKLQVNQFKDLIHGVMAKNREALDRMIGISMSSGKPGGDIDILIKRGY